MIVIAIKTLFYVEIFSYFEIAKSTKMNQNEANEAKLPTLTK